MIDMVNHGVLDDIAWTQGQMLARFEKTNQKLDSFNDVAGARLAESQATFARHTQLLLDAKKDLQSVFRRIRTLKARLSERYPEGFAAVQAGRTVVMGAAAVPGRDGGNAEDDAGEEHEAADASSAAAAGGGGAADPAEPNIGDGDVPTDADATGS